jgi:hypothetical protein
MNFKYNKKNAKCMWCKRTENPHPEFLHETIPTKIFVSMLGRQIELCFNCYEEENNKSNSNESDFKKNLDFKFEAMKLLKL